MLVVYHSSCRTIVEHVLNDTQNSSCVHSCVLDRGVPRWAGGVPLIQVVTPAPPDMNMKRCTNDYFVTRTILSIVQDVFNNSPTTRIINSL